MNTAVVIGFRNFSKNSSEILESSFLKKILDLDEIEIFGWIAIVLSRP